MNERPPPRFYFALPRLLAQFRHGDASRAEMNGAEAWAGSIAIFILSYLFFAGLILDHTAGWPAAAAALALPFFVLLFWLFALHVNTLILKVLRSCGVIRALPPRRGQAVLIGITVTAMALQLLQDGSLPGEIAAIWLCAVALNLIAAIVLALHHGTRPREK